MKEQSIAIIETLINNELERSMGFYPCSNNPHGAFGVIEEELCETKDEINNIADKMLQLQQVIFKAKGYPHQISQSEISLLDGIELDITHAICELIQTGAMCKKYRKAFDKTEL